MAANIFIRKQKITVSTNNEPLALSIRKQLNDSLQYDLIAMLEGVFAKYAPGDTYINIDKLKVNVGTVTMQDFEHKFFQIAAPYLAIELQKHMQENAQAFNTSAKQQRDHHSHPNTANALKIGGKQQQPNALNISSGKQQQINALLHFLAKGVYPWWYKNILQTPQEILQNLIEVENETLLLKIFSIKKNNSFYELQNVIERLFIYLSSSKHEVIIERLIALINEASITSNVKMLLQNVSQLSSLFSLSQAGFYKQLFYFLINSVGENNRDFIYAFLKKMKEINNISDHELERRLKENFTIGTTKQGKDIRQILETMLGKENITISKDDERTATSASEKKKPGAEENLPGTTLPQNEVSNPQKITEQKKGTPSSNDEEEGFYINNAGLVLLHPFLQSFFKELGLLDEHNKFLSADTQYKAAVLLYYLQSSDTEYREWEMAFNKIICHIPVEEVLPWDIIITEKEKAECDTLLQTIVNYWEALKGASIQGLQQTFILREGKISFKQEYWLIQVERTGTDILLDRLPWGFNTIKFPWLPHIIYTEW